MKIKKLIRPSSETIIWRYIGLDKFISLLTTERLVFSLVTIASDKNEILWILKNLEHTKEFKKYKEGATRHIQDLRNSTYISCWTNKENESRSLWATYLDSTKQGVAIKSTIGNFMKAVEWEDFSFNFAQVDYRNEFDFEELQSNDIAINTKSTAYIEESEIRFSINGVSEISEPFEAPEIYFRKLQEYRNLGKNRKKVISLKVNLEILINELMISPYSADWQKKNIIKLINDYKPELLKKISNSIVNE